MSTTKWLPFIDARQATPLLFLLLVHIAAFSTATITAAAQNTTTTADGDRLALLAIKSMITNDPQGFTTSWNNDSLPFCQWRGVTCVPGDQRVTVLNLTSAGLSGILSPSIGNLTFLTAILVQNNSLSGEIPPEIGRLFRLQMLRLNNNSFVGNIPASLSNCSDLQVLHVGFNNLVGKIPDAIGSLTKLNTLVVHRNRLQGGFPTFVANLTSLVTLSFADCGLGGTIPDIFHNLTNLARIAIPGNNFVGTVPPSLYNLSSLEQLFIDTNRLTGRLPTNLGSLLPRLEVFSLNDNQFTGQFPPSILSSPALAILDAARNNLSGKIVINSRQTCSLTIVSLSSNQFGSGDEDEMEFIDAMSICGNLGVLDVDDNQLRGFLPESLGNLSNLYFLSLASNGFSGGLPSSVTNLSGLTSLDLSINQLTGAIPVNIGNLRNLRRLDLKQNSFTGNIPGSLGNLSLLIDLHLGSNALTGDIPSSLGNLKRLLGLTLDQNNLSGDIPRQLFELSTLSITLNLGSNQLSGLLPQEVGNLQNLNEIILANNRLSGELPSSLGSCSSLQNLDISNNFFRGVLPSSLRSLRALENLNISRNNFTGRIPSYLEVMALENLNISFNDFEGEVLRRGVFANASSVSIVGNNRLCGGVSELRLPKCSSKKKNKLSLAVILVICIVSVVLLAAVVLFFVFYRRKRETQDDPVDPPLSGDSLIQVSYEMLHKATDGFSGKNFIGEGSFSSVYRGYLGKQGMVVAVKVLNLHRRGGSKSFITECEALRNARHRNLAKVITCCSGVDFQGNEFKAIVYEFMSNGSLDQWLHNNEQDEVPRLSLLQRVCIALDVAYALDYLHYRAGKTIIHCDLKPSNILLDEDMVAHVGDFGLSKILHSEYQNRLHSSSAGVRGTIGYAAPEYGVGSKVSRNGDMYGYGILLLEMMTSKRPTDAMFGDGLSLHSYAKKAMDDDGALEIVNGDDGQQNNDGESIAFVKKKTCLRLLLEIGVSCSMDSPQYRMDTNRVIQELQVIKDALSGDFSISHTFHKAEAKIESAALLVG